MIAEAIKVVGFDCDGVLFDSSSANRAYYDHLLEQVGMPAMTPDQFAYTHMHTVDESVAFLIRDSHKLGVVQQYRRQMSYLPFIRYMTMEPHLRSLLAWLRPAYNTAIATNRTDTMDRVLAEHGLEGAFDMVVTASDVRHPKPHPEQLLTVLTRFDIAPTQMVYIGDSELDAAAAHQAQIPFIAYANPALKADAHIGDLSEIVGLLGG